MLNSKSESTPRRVPRGLEEFAGDRQFATTLARGLELLRCFTPEEPVLGNKELGERLGLPAATISRLTYTLSCIGYLAPTEQYGKHQLGAAVLSLGQPLLAQFTLRRRARPLMIEVARATGGTVSIGIRDRLGVVYIEAIRHSHRRVYPMEIGERQNLAGTAVGRALLVACRPAEREAILNQLQVKAPEDWRRYGHNLTENLRHYARHGCCVSVGEVLADVQAVAVPLGRIDRGEPAAINCSFHGRPLDAEWLRREIAPQLQALARGIV